MRKVLLYFSLVSLFLYSGGCASGVLELVNSPNRGLVVGYIDMDDAPAALNYINIYQVFPKTGEPYWSSAVEKGMFYHFLPYGTYQVSNFGGGPQGWRRFFGNVSQYDFQFPVYGRNQTAIKVKKQDIYFMGSYKYKSVKTGFFEQDKFQILPGKTPTEREILKRLLENTKIKESQWEPMIKARLEALK